MTKKDLTTCVDGLVARVAQEADVDEGSARAFLARSLRVNADTVVALALPGALPSRQDAPRIGPAGVVGCTDRSPVALAG